MPTLPFRHRPLSQSTIASLSRQLERAPCPVCAEAEISVRSWFSAYAAETHTDPAMQATLRESLGLCAAHTRRLLDEGVAASWLAPGLFEDITRTGIRRLGAGTGLPSGRCPPCVAAARRASGMLNLVRTGLIESPALRQAYQDGPGPCVAHALQLLDGAGVQVAALAVDKLTRRLSGSPDERVETVVGLDPDGERRARSWSTHHDAVLTMEEHARKLAVAEYVDTTLGTPSCPLCAARVRAVWRFLGWLPTSGASPADLRLDAVLCPTHLTDLDAIAGTDAAGAFAAYNADRMVVDLRRTADRIGRLPTTYSDRLGRAWRAVVRREQLGDALLPDRGVERALVPVLRGTPCRACHFGELAERSERKLVGVVGADPARADALPQAHGLCLRHALRLSSRGELAASWQALALTRLRMLAYDLDIAIRNAGWDNRWQVHGAEMGAWRRAADLLDGTALGPRAAEPGEPARGAW